MDRYYGLDGFMRPKPLAGPLKVYQRDRLVGTVPAFPVASTSGIFDVRPGDFTPTMRDGEMTLAAAWNIGPGDFDCIAGFRRPDGDARPKSDAAETFDALVGTVGRLAAMEEVLAQGMAARSDATVQPAQPEGQQPGGEAMRPKGRS